MFHTLNFYVMMIINFCSYKYHMPYESDNNAYNEYHAVLAC